MLPALIPAGYQREPQLSGAKSRYGYLAFKGQQAILLYSETSVSQRNLVHASDRIVTFRVEINSLI